MPDALVSELGKGYEGCQATQVENICARLVSERVGVCNQTISDSRAQENQEQYSVQLARCVKTGYIRP